LHVDHGQAGLPGFLHSLSQLLNIVAQVDHLRAAGLERGMAGQDGVEVGGADGVNGGRPEPGKAVGDVGQKAVNHISSRYRAPLRTIDHYTTYQR